MYESQVWCTIRKWNAMVHSAVCMYNYIYGIVYAYYNGGDGDSTLFKSCLPRTAPPSPSAGGGRRGGGGLFWSPPPVGGVPGVAAARSCAWAPCTLLVVTFTVWDMWSGAVMSSNTAPAKLDPRRLACSKMHPVRLQFYRGGGRVNIGVAYIYAHVRVVDIFKIEVYKNTYGRSVLLFKSTM